MGVKFWLQKSCLCNKNDKYEVWREAVAAGSQGRQDPHLLKEVDGWAHAGHHQGKGGDAGHK